MKGSITSKLSNKVLFILDSVESGHQDKNNK